MPPIKIEPGLVDDNQYRFVPSLGRVRTGPRGSEYWESRNLDSSSSSSSVNRGYDSYRPDRSKSSHLSINRGYDSYRPAITSSSGTSLQRPSEEPPASDEPKVECDAYNFSNHNQLLNDMFAAAQRSRSRNASHDNDLFNFRDSRRSESRLPARQSTDVHDPYRDDRRSSTQNPNRTINQEPCEEENSLFIRETTITSSPSPTPEPEEVEAGEFHDEPMLDSSDDSTPPSLPPPPAHTRISGTCICPIDRDCPAKADHLIDCRTLVVEWQKWATSQAEGEIEEIPADVAPEDEVFATVEEASRIVQLVEHITEYPANTLRLRTTFNQLTSWISPMTTRSITETNLTASNALPTIQSFLSVDNAPLRQAKHVPAHIEEDLLILLRKWTLGDYSQLPSRGLIRSSPNGLLHSEPNWPFRRSAKFFGHGHLVNGQTWGRRVEMARDGAHGPFIAGISGGKNTGAYSVVMGYHDTYRHEYYADIDCGNRIYYLSTALPAPPPTTNPANGEVTEPDPSNYKDPIDANFDDGTERECTTGAKALMKSAETGNPVRVFRSFRARKICPHRPRKGFRYDGLYEVVDFECLKAERGIWRFEMIRLPEMKRDEGEFISDEMQGGRGGVGGNGGGAGGAGRAEDRNTGPIRSGVPAEAVNASVRLAGRRRREALRGLGHGRT